MYAINNQSNKKFEITVTPNNREKTVSVEIQDNGDALSDSRLLKF